MKNTTLVWDPLVRLFHWSMVIAFATAWITSDDMEKLHIKVGYVILGLVCFRLLWGFFGSNYARFSQFVRSPKTVLSYLSDISLGREKRYLGHNPAGGFMILALILGLLGISVTGWMYTTDMFWGVDWVEEVHETFAFLLLFGVAAHVLGVIVASLRHKENLVKSMINGYKKSPSDHDIA
jgi:cytochrome b